jgi:heme exporter protein C
MNNWLKYGLGTAILLGLGVGLVLLLGRADRSRFGATIRGGLLGLGLLGVAVGGWLGLAWAPPDREMGDVARIMYAHVPLVWVALLAMTANFVASLTYLLFTQRLGERRAWKVDSLAESCAEVGVVLGATGVLLGAIWGKPTWGVWWDWDPRLTTAAIMLVLYTGYLVLRRFIEDPERRASLSAVVGIIAFVDLPILWFSVQWWRSLHQVQSTPQTVDPEMTFALRFNAFAFLFVTVAFIWYRYRIALRAREEELVLPSALPEQAASSDAVQQGAR